MVKELKFDKWHLITRPREYFVNGVTFTVTPVYDGKQGVDIRKQFEKCYRRFPPGYDGMRNRCFGLWQILAHQRYFASRPCRKAQPRYHLSRQAR